MLKEFAPGQSLAFEYNGKIRVVTIHSVKAGPEGLYLVCQTADGWRSFLVKKIKEVQTS